MRKTDLKEAVGFLSDVLAVVQASAIGATKAKGADLFRQIGALLAGAETAISSGTLGAPLLGCFDAAWAAGATLTTIGQVRLLVVSRILHGRPAILVQQGCLRMALVEESKILAKTPLVSRRDVDAYQVRVNSAFDPAETFAADARDADTYRALVSLHAAVSADLATRGRPLPRIVTYEFAKTMPALTLSNRIYGDAARTSDLLQENQIFHPAFCPRGGTALSA